MWEKFPSGGPPPNPPFGNFHIFFTVFFNLFLPFYKPLNWKKQRKIWSGFGSDPPPQFGNFSHIIPFFLKASPTANYFCSNFCIDLSAFSNHSNALQCTGEAGSGKSGDPSWRHWSVQRDIKPCPAQCMSIGVKLSCSGKLCLMLKITPVSKYRVDC